MFTSHAMHIDYMRKRPNTKKELLMGDELLKLMVKGYPLGKITKSRDEWHGR